MHAVLIGNYGAGNLGDDLLREFFTSRFPDVMWSILSASPSAKNEVPRLPFGVRSFFKPWWRTLRAIRKADAVVFGGGSLFTDIESRSACVLWWIHAFTAWMLGTPIVLAFQGIGPLQSRLGTACTRWVVKHAAFISVRDTESEKRVLPWARVPVVVTADPVFLLFRDHAAGERGTALGLIPRMNSGERFWSAVEPLIHEDIDVRIISIQPDDPAEIRVCNALIEKIGQHASFVPARSMQELVDGIRACERIVAERYHGALAGLAMGVSVGVIPQRTGDKLDMLQRASADVAGVSDFQAAAERGYGELLKYMNML